jgi:hypothetical protein
LPLTHFYPVTTFQLHQKAAVKIRLYVFDVLQVKDVLAIGAEEHF